MGLHSATIVSVLVHSGCTAGSLLAACGVGVVLDIMGAQSAEIATCKMGHRCTQQCTVQCTKAVII
jgi:hypothetical protein